MLNNQSQDVFNRDDLPFVLAAIPAVLFAGLIDGGVSIALAFGANKLYNKFFGKG